MSELLRKLAYSGTGPAKPISKEIWIGPKHWESMDEEQKCFVVDLYHRMNKYSNSFPFDSMTNPDNMYSVGITFNMETDNEKNENAIGSIAQEELKVLKIPHAVLDYSEIEKKRSEYMESIGKKSKDKE
ncbi:MAG: hypothetical protein WCY30_00185 [Candidatus Neomarinimicrobiota bacterium]|jgi:hypothetical protein